MLPTTTHGALWWTNYVISKRPPTYQHLLLSANTYTNSDRCNKLIWDHITPRLFISLVLGYLNLTWPFPFSAVFCLYFITLQREIYVLFTPIHVFNSCSYFNRFYIQHKSLVSKIWWNVVHLTTQQCVLQFKSTLSPPAVLLTCYSNNNDNPIIHYNIAYLWNICHVRLELIIKKHNRWYCCLKQLSLVTVFLQTVI